jgi:hypothetical protein
MQWIDARRFGWSWLVLIIGLHCVAAVEPTALATTAVSPPRYEVHFPGFYDGPHISVNGSFSSHFDELDGPGNALTFALGESTRYNALGRSRGASSWVYDIANRQLTRVGLFFDAPVGLQHNSNARFINAQAQAVGYVFLGDSVPAEDAAWFFDPAVGSSRQIGLFNRSDLQIHSANDFPLAINDAGLVAGIWDSGTSGAPRYLWAYDPGTNQTTRIGLFDSAHATGVEHTSEFNALSENGYIVGTAHQRGHRDGRSVWQYDSSTGVTTRLGIYDGLHTRASGEQYSRFRLMNDLGFVAGESYAEWTTPNGPTAAMTGWIYDPNTKVTHKVGLSQNGGTEPDSFLSDSVSYISPAGFALGSSGMNLVIEKPWIHELASGVSTRLGFDDAAHTLSNNRNLSSIVQFDDTGRVAGHSRRNAGILGNSAWLYERSTGQTTQLGLLGPQYFAGGLNGAHESRIQAMNDDGYIVGVTRNGGNQFGGIEFTAWIFDPTTRTTTPIGQQAALAANIRFNYPRAINNKQQVVGGDDKAWWFYDPQAAGDGIFINPRDASHGDAELDFLTESGYVVGHSERLSGQSSWFFDPVSRQTTLLVFSERNNGAAFTSVNYLGEDGVALGLYDLYSGDTLVGRRPFYWSPAQGFHDLSDLIVRGDNPFAWDGLIERLTHVSPKLIAGFGRLPNGQVAPFILTAVPEPASAAFAAVGVIACLLHTLRNGQMRTLRTRRRPLATESP